jgi:hypothetical protein
MPLKLTVSKGDQVIMSNGCVIEVKTTSNKQTCLEFHAPKDLKIHAIFSDPAKRFKNARKKADKAIVRASESDSQVNQPSVEEQQKRALERIIKREK